jgi:hypothetical protein
MDSGEGTTPPHELGKLFRCARCGVESAERTCFILPGQYSRPPRDVRCITCEHRRLAPSAAAALLILFASLIWPLWLVLGLAPANVDLGTPTLIFACLLLPLAVIVHELGHAVTAHFIGLKVGAIGIGFGRVIWKFEFRGLPIRLHIWPLAGVVYLGAASAHLLRTRLWFATLMGPMTNLLFACATAIWWKPLVSSLGFQSVGPWLTTNLFLAATALYPRRVRVRGITELVPSDGLALLQIPRATQEKLEVHLYSAPLMRAFARYEDGDFAGAVSIAAEALAQTPNIALLRLMRAASYLSDGDYSSGMDISRSLLSDPAAQEPNIRAAVRANLAFGIVMSNIGADVESSPLQEAERRSREAFEAYPCALELRCTRALALAAIGRPEQGLETLNYVHFDTATRRQRSQRESARAFVFRRLGSVQDAEQAAALAVQLDRASLRTVQSMGFSPAPGTKAIEPRLRRNRAL